MSEEIEKPRRTRRVSRRLLAAESRKRPESKQTTEIRKSTKVKDSQASSVIISCSALMRDISHLCKLNNWTHLETQCISAELHNRPDQITAEVKKHIDLAKQKNQNIFVVYGDCGTGGQLDRLLEQEGVERVAGDHCYEFLTSKQQFAQFQENEIGTYYLTDFLVRHFERLVIRGMGLDKKPELEPMMFGSYKKLLYIAQTEDVELQQLAKKAADRLGLEYEYYFGGTGILGSALVEFDRQITQQKN